VEAQEKGSVQGTYLTQHEELQAPGGVEAVKHDREALPHHQ
jgi:hypothetical protein